MINVINFLRVEHSSFPLMTMETQQKCLHAKIYGFLSLLFLAMIEVRSYEKMPYKTG